MSDLPRTALFILVLTPEQNCLKGGGYATNTSHQSIKSLLSSCRALNLEQLADSVDFHVNHIFLLWHCSPFFIAEPRNIAKIIGEQKLRQKSLTLFLALWLNIGIRQD